ncbi:glycosyltransferase [Microbacterium flavescens]|uniref:glycosyltransferase n=1 Tax=Microbacterium flavescens TaxID=69366 RepID=UPI001BDE4488|nr:glycosyltransferase [Microbacterium flavescens]
MTAAFVDVVIACHDETRPLERAVRSLFQDPAVRDRVRATVVAHGLAPELLERKLSAIDGDWRVVGFSDGVRSAAGPFNHGLALVESEYCAVMGSDDFLEPGAMAQWVAYAEKERPDAAIARIRIDGQPIMPNPLTRVGRRRRLDAAKDRLFYRTAPLGLIRTATMRARGLAMTEGVRVGEDFEFGIRLFSQSDRVDFLGDAPCYVIGVDARERTTLAPMSMEEGLAAVVRLLDDGLPAQLAPAHRRALAIKLVRISVIGNARSRPDAAQWRDDDEVRFLASLLQRLVALAPRVLEPFNLQDRGILDGLLAEPTIARVTADAARAARAGRRERWLTRNPLRSFGRETMLRRYVLYVLKRERKAPRP